MAVPENGMDCGSVMVESELELELGDRRSEKDKFEESLIKLIREGDFEKIRRNVTPKALMGCESNFLIMAMKVSYELHSLAGNGGPDKDDVIKLANSVEELTMRILDPLKYNKGMRSWQYMDELIDIADELEQTKVITHPAIESIITHKWYGQYTSERKRSWLDTQTWVWFFINIWCLFDLFLCPVLFTLFSIFGNWSSAYARYSDYFSTPYFIFVRDTLSYLVLLGLHIAICLAPSSIAFSGLEWAILVFFLGRLLVELKQINDINVNVQRSGRNAKIPARVVYMKKLKLHLSDRWNKLDFISLFVYLTAVILRIVTWAVSTTVIHNRALVLASYLYGLNTMLLTFRAVGQLMESSKGVGIIQIAFFNIIGDIGAIVGQFFAAMLSFSVAITKIYVAEKSFFPDDDRDIACNSSGISCWWMVTSHLGVSLLGLANLDALKSSDLASETIVLLLYAVFLLMGVVLLINMLIALLSNTYQQVSDNSSKIWSLKNAVAVKTYSNYNPIPVPLNIAHALVLCLRDLACGKPTMQRKGSAVFDMIVARLQDKYCATYGYSFPTTDEMKLDQVVRKTESTHRMVNQILKTTFTGRGRDQDTLLMKSDQWELSDGLYVEGCLLTCEGTHICLQCSDDREFSIRHVYGAKQVSPFSRKFPHFEVLIQETIEGSLLGVGVGVVREDYGIHDMPGWKKGTVGYYSGSGQIITGVKGKETGLMASEGDLICCTVLFDGDIKMENDHPRISVHEENHPGVLRTSCSQVTVVFRLNGSNITQEQIRMDCKPGENLYPYIGIMDKGFKVLAKMRSVDIGDYQTGSSTRENSNQHRQLEDIRLHLQTVDKKVDKTRECLEEKIDMVLTRLTEIERDAIMRIC